MHYKTKLTLKALLLQPHFRPMIVLRKIRDLIIAILDWLYPPFSRLMTRQLFRYAATGGANVVLDIILYAIVYAFVLKGEVLDLGVVSLSNHVAAFFIVFPITFCVGFALAKYVTFTSSNLKGRIQLFRYFSTVIGAIILNYVLLKLFVDMLHIYPITANMMNKFIVIAYSYFAQTYFSFRSAKSPHKIKT